MFSGRVNATKLLFTSRSDKFKNKKSEAPLYISDAHNIHFGAVTQQPQRSFTDSLGKFAYFHAMYEAVTLLPLVGFCE